MCNLVYGFETPATTTGFAELHLLVDILSEWPKKTEFLKHMLDRYGGCVLFKLFPCFKKSYCELCQECPEEERENVHQLLDLIHDKLGKSKFVVLCLLAKFATRHGSELFEKRWEESSLPSHLQLKYK